VVEGDAGAHGDAFEGVVGDVAGRMPISCVTRRSRLRRREVPPVRMMPRSTTSEASSGGVRSRTERTAPTIDWRESLSLQRDAEDLAGVDHVRVGQAVRDRDAVRVHAPALAD